MEGMRPSLSCKAELLRSSPPLLLEGEGLNMVLFEPGGNPLKCYSDYCHLFKCLKKFLYLLHWLTAPGKLPSLSLEGNDYPVNQGQTKPRSLEVNQFLT